MKSHKITLELSISPRTFRYALAGLLLSVGAADLGSEQVVLSTYYPAPSGVYTQMVTTQNTYLARDIGGQVGIGTTSPAFKLDVFGSFGETFDGTNNGLLRVVYTAAAPAGYYATYSP